MNNMDIGVELENLVCTTITTKEASVDFVSQIDSLKKSLGEGTTDLDSLNDSRFAPVFNQIMSSLDTLGGFEKLPEILDAFREHVISLQSLEIELSFTPSEEFSKKLYQWFLDAGFSKFLIKFTTKPEMHGGLCLSWRGNYVNLTLESSISTYLMENKDGIERILHKKIQ